MNTLDPFITKLDNDLMAEVKSFSLAAPAEQRPPGVHKKPYQAAPAAPVTRTPTKGKPVGNTLPCLSHNPKMGLECEKMKTGQCRFHHLDTNDPKQHKLFNIAQEAFNQKRESRSAGKGQRKGRGKAHYLPGGPN